MHRIQDIADAMNARFVGDGDLVVRGPRAPSEAGLHDLAMAMGPEYAEVLSAGSAQAAVLGNDMDWQGYGLKAAIFVDRPRYAMAHVTGYFAEQTAPGGIHPTAVIDPSATVAPGADIGAFVVIGPRAKIGENARIASHCSIGHDAVLGANSRLAEGARVMHRVQIGNNVIIHANAIIGSDGFSFVTPAPGNVDALKETGSVAQTVEEQSYVRIHSLGAVRVGDDVEIGAGCAIDRGTIADTVIGNGTKLDNLVQIGHNVRIGETCLICGQVGIAGSAVIGDRVVLAGQVGVADHVTVGDNVIAAGKSGISSNVPPNRAIMGNPAVQMDSNIASYKAVRRLPRFISRLEAVEKQVSKITVKR